MLAIILACVFMAVRDALGTLLTVAESRGRSLLAATFDATGDLASVGVTVYGAGVVLNNGWTGHTFLVLGAMMLTSFAGTAYWTRVATQWMPAESLTARVETLERLSVGTE